MPRSKSPKGKKGGGGGFNLNDANVQLAISSLAICVLAYIWDGDGEFDQNTVTQFFMGQHMVPYFPFGGFVLTMHCLNTCQNAGSGFWVNSFAHAFFACFSGPIMLAVVTGNTGSLWANEGNATLVFVCWYFTNHDVPVVGTDVWGTIKDAGGDILGQIMSLCTLCTQTAWIFAGVSAASDVAPGWCDHSWFVPMAFGIFAGCGGSFFPLNKGLNFKNNANMERTMLIAFFLASDGCKNFPFVGDALGGVVAQATAPFAFEGSAHGADHASASAEQGFVMTVTIFDFLFGHFVPIEPLGGAIDFLYQISGLNRG